MFCHIKVRLPAPMFGPFPPSPELDEVGAWAQRLGYEVVATCVDRLSAVKRAEDRPARRDALRAAHRRE